MAAHFPLDSSVGTTLVERVVDEGGGTTAGPRLGSWVVSACSSVILRNLKS
jgi:hypothetical protein